MKKEEYLYNFAEEARYKGKDEQYIEKWKEYASNLLDKGLPVIYDQHHFCLLVGYEECYVYSVSNSPKLFYHNYKIPKKSGGYRQISEPYPSLKEIQRWILDNILSKVEVSVYAKAYVSGKSIRDNVRFHRKQDVLLSLDVKDFFESISPSLVYKVFENMGYASDVTTMLTKLCCFNGGLPQGSPTSPAISNIIMKDFDVWIGSFVTKKGIRYTRYADDLTFSGRFKPKEVISRVKKGLYQLGFKLNKEKTRIRRSHQRQMVTGVVVNEKLQLPKETRRYIRQEMYYIKKFGIQSHMEHREIQQRNYVEHLRGKIQFGLFVNRYDEELKGYIEYLDWLKANY